MKSSQPIKSILLIVLLALVFTAQASHRVLMFNDLAMEKVLDLWPEFVDSVNGQARGMENPGERAILVPSPLRSHINQLLREQPTPEQFSVGFKLLAEQNYLPAGITTFGSKVSTSNQVTGFHHLLREEGRLPVRFAWSYEEHRQPMPAAAAAALYTTIGVQWQTIEANPWLWLRGISTEGDWDAPNRPCMGDDLAAKAGVDEREVKEVQEICPDFDSPTVQALIRGLRAGWRFVGVHGVGSHGLRIFLEKLEEQMEKNPKTLTLEYVRDMRNGLAHGHMVGAVPDVVEGLKKYNIYLPINVRRALDTEPENIDKYYGEPGYAFLAPVKTLLDQGVKVVGEAEIQKPNPETYFDVLEVHVTREMNGEVYVPEEAIDRVTALKLFTIRSAEFNYADSKVGSLELGKYADFIVIDNDYLEGPDEEISNNKVIMTVVGGERAYNDPAFEPAIKTGATLR